MKEISLPKKLKVIEMFFAGYTYDDIAEELGIGKGSVVNIIEAFRNGELQIAPNQYLDTIRELVVDMRKQHTNVKKLQVYVAIDKKLGEMGVGVDKVEDWLDIVQEIATENNVSTKKFVAASLDLAYAEIETGHDPASLFAEFKSKHEALNKLKTEITQTEECKEKELAELDTINQAKAAAQEQYTLETTELKAKLDKYVAESELNWNLVKTVKAILHDKLGKEGLDEKDKLEISEQIAKIGSLTTAIKAKVKENDALEKHVQELKEDVHNMEMSSIGLHKHNDQLASHVYAVLEEKKTLDKQVDETKLQLDELKTVKYHFARDIYTGWLVLASLHNPEVVSDHDFDELVELMNGVRLARLGKKPKQVVNAEGKVVCQCQVPVPYIPPEDYGVAMDEARERLAECLMPLVDDKFVPKFEYKQAKLMNEMKEMYEQLSSALSGHLEASEQPGSPEQNTTLEEPKSHEQPDGAITIGTAIPGLAAYSEIGIDYWSPEAIKARWKADKEFNAKMGPRTCNIYYPWESDK
jgi:hypothetical protein